MNPIPLPAVPEITGPVTVTWRNPAHLRPTVYLRRTVFGVTYWTVA